MYTKGHLEYVVQIAEEVAAQKESLVGFEIVEEPQRLRHFSASLEPVSELLPIVPSLETAQA